MMPGSIDLPDTIGGWLCLAAGMWLVFFIADLATTEIISWIKRRDQKGPKP